MSRVDVTNISGLQLRLSPFNAENGALLRSVNMDTDSIGALKKRSGYDLYLGTPDNDQVNSLFDWHTNSGTQFWNYRASGSALYYSTQGTGAWTICGNGTIADGTTVGYSVLEDTLIIGDGIGSTRVTTNGTSFTDVTDIGPLVDFEEYDGRMWGIGTASNAFFSTVGTPNDWTTDSSSILIPGAGKLNSVVKSNDRLIFTKNSGKMFKWDGYNLIDMSTDLGPSSPSSIGEVEGFKIYLNRTGYYGYGGDRPELISAPIQRQIYNDDGTGIAGTTFDNAPGVVHQYHYYCSVGTVTDDLTRETVSNCIQRYDFQLDDWDNYQFADRPTAFHSYKDENGNQQLIFGDANGQCYKSNGTTYNDNGETISSVIEGFLWGSNFLPKKWNWLLAMFNPGSQAKIQVALTDTFTKENLKWIDLGPAKDGVVEYRFPSGSRGRFLMYKVYEASRDSRFQFYGFEVDADAIER